jgi:hypothetical protein
LTRACPRDLSPAIVKGKLLIHIPKLARLLLCPRKSSNLEI